MWQMPFLAPLPSLFTFPEAVMSCHVFFQLVHIGILFTFYLGTVASLPPNTHLCGLCIRPACPNS